MKDMFRKRKFQEGQNQDFSQNKLRKNNPFEIHRAAMLGDINTLVGLLSENKEIVDETDFAQCTALHYAAIHSQPAVIDLLLLHQARIDLCDNKGFTPLYYATLNRTQPGMALKAKEMYESKYSPHLKA